MGKMNSITCKIKYSQTGPRDEIAAAVQQLLFTLASEQDAARAERHSASLKRSAVEERAFIAKKLKQDKDKASKQKSIKENGLTEHRKRTMRQAQLESEIKRLNAEIKEFKKKLCRVYGTDIFAKIKDQERQAKASGSETEVK